MPTGRGAEPGITGPGLRARLRLIGHMATTFAGGYPVLRAIVVAYYFGPARVSGNFLETPALAGAGRQAGPPRRRNRITGVWPG